MLIEHPLLTEAFDAIKDTLFNAFRTSPIRDVEGQHEIRLMFDAIDKVERYLKQIADTGKMADFQLEKDAKIAEFKAKNKFA